MSHSSIPFASVFVLAPGARALSPLRLHLTTHQPEVRSQDSVALIVEVARTPYGRSLAWNFFREHYAVRLYSLCSFLTSL
jgi:hypothetical protein